MRSAEVLRAAAPDWIRERSMGNLRPDGPDGPPPGTAAAKVPLSNPNSIA